MARSPGPHFAAQPPFEVRRVSFTVSHAERVSAVPWFASGAADGTAFDTAP